MLRLEYTENGKVNYLGMDVEYVPYDKSNKPRDTVVFLYDYYTDDVRATGIANLHVNDTFSKVMGRKIAFSRAVENFTPDKRIRSELWRSFLKQVKVGPGKVGVKQTNMENNNKVNIINGISPVSVLGITFIVLKLIGVVGWSWWWVTAPFWVPFAMATVVIVFGVAVALLVGDIHDA